MVWLEMAVIPTRTYDVENNMFIPLYFTRRGFLRIRIIAQPNILHCFIAEEG